MTELTLARLCKEPERQSQIREPVIMFGLAGRLTVHNIEMFRKFVTFNTHHTALLLRERAFDGVLFWMHSEIFDKRNELLIQLALDISTNIYDVNPTFSIIFANGKKPDFTDLAKFNVEQVMKQIDDRIQDFPELCGRIANYYVEKCKKRTFGMPSTELDFLNEPSSHLKLQNLYAKKFGVTPKFSDCSKRNEKIEKWTDEIRAISNAECLSETAWIDVLNQLCEYSILKANGTYVSNLIGYSFSNKCNAGQSFQQAKFTCSVPKNRITAVFEGTASSYYQQVLLASLQECQRLIKQMQLARAENNESGHLKLEEHLKGLLQAFSLVSSPFAFDMANQVYDGNWLYVDAPESFNNNSLVSRESTFKTMIFTMRFSSQNRAAVLFNWAVKRLQNETINAEELSPYSTRSVIEVVRDMNHPWFEELRPRLVAHYEEHCRNYTFGIDRHYLDFLGEPESHRKIAAMYTEMFTPVSIDLKYTKLNQ